MKKRVRVILIVLAALVVAGVAAFLIFGRGGDGYLSMIPKDAKGIVRLDLRSIIKKADMSSDQLQTLMKRLTDDDATEMTEVGIDLSKPLFGFVSQSGFFALAGKMHDEDALANMLSHVNGQQEIQRQRGYSWALLKGNYLLAFNDDKVLCMGPAVGAAQDQLRNEMYRYLEQDKEESAVGTAFFDQVSENHAPGAAILSMSLVPESLRKSVSKYIPASVTDDVSMAITLDVGEHNVHLATELLTDNEEAKAKIASFESLFRTIDARFVDSSTENTFAWCCMNVDGTQLLDMLRSIPAIRLALIGVNMMVDVDQMIRAVDGDVAIDMGMAPNARSKDDVQLLLTAQVGNTDFLKKADYWVRSSHLNLVQRWSDTDFCLKMSGSPVWFGVDDDVLYFSSVKDMRKGKGNPFVSAQKSDIKGTRIFVTFDLSKAGAYAKDVQQYADICRNVTFSMKDLGAFRLNIEGAQDKNLLYDMLMN